MSLGRKLSLDAGAAIGTDDRGMARSRRQYETVARSHGDTTCVREDEIDRAASAVEKFGVAVLVLAVAVSGRIRPSIHLTGLVAQRRLDRVGIGRGRAGVPAVFDFHGSDQGPE